jgi:tagaturonate reductase
MKLLNKEIEKKEYKKIKIMQFGEGNFLRAFVDWIIQTLSAALICPLSPENTYY